MQKLIPKVSIGLPVYNGERYLENAINKMLEQEYQDFELIISDNASTDKTQEICLEFAQKDSRIRYFRNEKNIGLSRNHNRTYEMARGEYFKWISHDDDYPKNMLRRFIETFQEQPESVCLVYSYCEYIDMEGNILSVDSDGVAKANPWPHRRLTHYLSHVHMYNSPYGLMKSRVLRKTHLEKSFPGSDHVLMAELAMLGIFIEIPEPLLRIRKHLGRSFTANRTASELRELFNPGNREKGLYLDLWSNLHLEVVRSSVIIPPTIRDKILCTLIALMVPLYWRLRGFSGRQKRKAFELIDKKLEKK